MSRDVAVRTKCDRRGEQVAKTNHHHTFCCANLVFTFSSISALRLQKLLISQEVWDNIVSAILREIQRRGNKNVDDHLSSWCLCTPLLCCDATQAWSVHPQKNDLFHVYVHPSTDRMFYKSWIHYKFIIIINPGHVRIQFAVVCSKQGLRGHGLQLYTLDFC